MLHGLASWDQQVGETWAQLRWEPLTAFFVLVSAWWVKAPLFVVVGGVADLRARRRFPRATASAATAVATAALLAGLLKELVDRLRPAFADPTFTAAVTTPDTPSFPSGHATTAFAAAVAVSSFFPRLRVPLLALATLVGVSRVYLGVHFALDVLAGAALGTAIGLTVAWSLRSASRRVRGSASRAASATTR